MLSRNLEGTRFPIAVAHGEGRFQHTVTEVKSLAESGLTSLIYTDDQGREETLYPGNPNGSASGLAGLCSEDGRVTIMMPHPERVVLRTQLSFAPTGTARFTPWMGLFDNAWRFVTDLSEVTMDWVGVDPLQQVVSRGEAMDLIPWLSIRWQTTCPCSGHYFWWDGDGLSLKSAEFDLRSRVHVDFVHGSQARRIKAVTGEALTRAVGCQKDYAPQLSTQPLVSAGTLSVLANLGCKVLAMERDPVVAALLVDALRRAEEAEIGWCDRLRFRYADSAQMVSRVSHGVIYLDPMFQRT